MSIEAAGLVGPDGTKLAKFEYPDAFAIPNIEIVGPRLLVLPAARVEYTTKGGIVVPEHAQERTRKGIVLLGGDGIMLENGKKLPPRVKPGWEVLFARYAGTELEIEGNEYLIIQESDVRAIFTFRGNLIERLKALNEKRANEAS